MENARGYLVWDPYHHIIQTGNWTNIAALIVQIAELCDDVPLPGAGTAVNQKF